MVMVLMFTIIMLAGAYVSEVLRLACYVFSSYFWMIIFVVSCDGCHHGRVPNEWVEARGGHECCSDRFDFLHIAELRLGIKVVNIKLIATLTFCL